MFSTAFEFVISNGLGYDSNAVRKDACIVFKFNRVELAGTF